MSQVTAAQLIDRLREVYETESGERLSDEKLAGRLPITLSTFNRWKKGDTRAFRDTIAMLDKAGWLSIPADGREVGDSAPTHPVDMQAAAASLLLGQAEGLDRLQEIVQKLDEALASEPSARKRAAPRKTAAQRKRP